MVIIEYEVIDHFFPLVERTFNVKLTKRDKELLIANMTSEPNLKVISFDQDNRLIIENTADHSKEYRIVNRFRYPITDPVRDKRIQKRILLIKYL